MVKDISQVGDRVWDERRLRIATQAAGVALWSWNVAKDWISMDDLALELWGLPPKYEVTFEEMSVRVHPPDLEKVRAAFNAMRELSGDHEFDFRILHGDELRWVSARTRGDSDEHANGIMYGVFLDVTARMRAEEQREMLMREMRHRIKNLFTLSGAVASIASKTAETKEEMLQDLTRRLRCLAAAHNLIHPRADSQIQPIKLDELLNALLEPYSGETSRTKNISVAAPFVMIGERNITSLAMLIHELATNSAKYGALAADSGKLVLACYEKEDDLEIVWNESGGPASHLSSEKIGFGSEMMKQVVEQINGEIKRDWTNEGLIVTLRLSKEQLGVRGA